MNDLNNATYSLNNDLPSMISYIEIVKGGGGYADPNFQTGIDQTSSDFDLLQNKISLVDNTINAILTTGNLIINLENFAKSAVSYIPIIGGSLQDFLNDLLKVTNDLQTDIASLKTYADTLSNNITIEKNILNTIADTANHKSDDFINGWNNRQTAWIRVIAIPMLLILILIAIALYVYYKTRP